MQKHESDTDRMLVHSTAFRLRMDSQYEPEAQASGLTAHLQRLTATIKATSLSNRTTRLRFGLVSLDALIAPAAIAALTLLLLASSLTQTTFVDDQVRPPTGRLAIVADGNSPDPDDIGATAVMFGLLKATNLQDRLVHLSHSCDLKPTDRISAADELRRQQVLDQVCREGVEQFGRFNNLAGFFNCRTQQKAAVEDLRKAISESTEENPLWIIEAGEPDIIGYALEAADASKTKFVHVISHHPANDNAGDFFKWQQILDFGVHEHQIGDQNVGLKTETSQWDWAQSHDDAKLKWIWKQLAYAEQDGIVKFQTNKFDCSDAGMLYWWITGANNGGDAHATPAEIKAMLLSMESKRLPDIVVYLADDLSASDLSLYGGTNIKTPAIDQLAAEGMTFNRAFVASPSCASSRAALLTGLMPARNGAEENHSYPREEVLKLPTVLNKLGYQTAAFGKVAHLRSAPDYHFDVHDRKQHIPELRETVKSFLETRTDKRPLALFVGVSDPHVPWPSESTVDPQAMSLPPKLLDTPRTRVQRSRYLQEVINLDAYLGELRELTDKHMSKDKLFVFSSDHGAQFPFGKWTLYDEGIHVPLIVAHSSKIKAGSRTDAMVSWIDVLPTLIEAGGGEVPDGLDGRSFQNVLYGETDTHRSRIFTTHSGDQLMNVYLSRSVRTDRYKFIWNPHPDFAFTTHIEMLLRETSGDYFKQWTELAKTDSHAAEVVARHHGRPEFELFDLKQDPNEQSSLADDPKLADVKEKLFGELKEWIKSQNDELTVFHEPLMLDAPETWVPRKKRKREQSK
ncbi:Arylsulfatase [Mariniblastus fucicola]|uniref:Arylsulfatase n=1 Tax=Mariniblastus fucicola TaxID=980251 RepID=A0A5B9P865_9BACT|nr:Arylsulfatase [Mariniblastus fucicola]